MSFHEDQEDVGHMVFFNDFSMRKNKQFFSTVTIKLIYSKMDKTKANMKGI